MGEENWYDTGPDHSLKSDHPPSTSVGNKAHVAAGNFDLPCSYSVGRSNGALNGVLSEAESTSAHPYAPGNASSTCNLLNPAAEQVALEAGVSEPCRAESASSRDCMADRNAVIDGCVFEGERPREAGVRAWNWIGRLEGQASPPQGQANPVQAVGSCLLSPFDAFVIESLGSTPNSAIALVRREAVIIRAFIKKIRR